MLTSLSRYLVRVSTCVVAAGFMFASLATAQTPNSAIDQFLANPTQTLQQYQNGGADLISLIRDAALAHPEALQTIIGLLANANSDQQMTIGSGLGQAAKNADQAYANTIATAIANSASSLAGTAFAAVTGNVLIGSADGGGGGIGGGSGGSTGTFGFAFGGTNSGTVTPPTEHFQTSSQTFTGGGGGVGGTTSSGGGTTSVSRH
ncbi:MAG TPA: hypothetical protein VIK28_08275 [Sedimentisphaerales bacterium]